jgi:uncharacterized protein
MILDLREFEEFPARSTSRAGPGEFKPFADGVTAVGEVKLELAIQQSGEEYFCQGEVSAGCMTDCARCLIEFEQQIRQSVDFIVHGGGMTDSNDGLPDDETYVFLQGNDLLADVTEPVRQAMVLSFPMKPLCSDNCLGLCPHCGANLNKQSCDCARENSDSRWDGLKRLAGRGRQE